MNNLKLQRMIKQTQFLGQMQKEDFHWILPDFYNH